MSLRIHEAWCESNPNRSKNLKIPSRKGKYSDKGKHKEEASERTKRRRYTKQRKEECLSNGEFICKFCEFNCNLGNDKSSFLSFMCHESQCPDNPCRIRNPITEETKEKLRKKMVGRKYSQERKDKISAYMKKAVEEHPESYSNLNRFRAKKVMIDGVRFDSAWEIIFYDWAKNQGLNPQRCLEHFDYDWEGQRKYFPDFYIDSLKLYVEVKGCVTDRYKAKWRSFPKKLKIIMKDEIEEIKKGTFRGLV